MASFDEREQLLSELFDSLVKVLIQELKNPDIPASKLKEIREFLKDNEIQHNRINSGDLDRLQSLVSSLPFTGEDAY